MSTAVQILEALEYFHKHRIVHRDLKPSNVMFFSKEQRWKLTDLGSTATAGQASPLSYTLMYAPPEVVAADVRGKKEVAVETSADMWSFGIMAYELATGEGFLWYIRFQSTASSVICRQCINFE